MEYTPAITPYGVVLYGANGQIVVNSAKFGSATNYSEFEADGTLKFVGDATVWDDLRTPVTSTILGGSKQPGFAKLKDDGAGSQGVFIYWFDNSTEEELYFTLQIPHSYKEATDIIPHVHWTPVNANVGVVEWGLEYNWVNIDGTFGNTSIIYATQAVNNNAYKHFMTNFAAISGSGKTISSMLACRIFRNAAGGNDTYDSDAGLIEIDFHFEKDTVGSRGAVTK